MFKHILLPTDGSELATAALKRGIALAKEMGATVTLIGVIEELHVLTANPAGLHQSLAKLEAAAEEQLRASIAAGVASARAAGVEAKSIIVRDVDPAGEITRLAEREGCDLIALASHGRRGLRKLVLGSVTQRVVSAATVPVLVLR
jgi:nucleotide-binding universal stress UspA family protein